MLHCTYEFFVFRNLNFSVYTAGLPDRILSSYQIHLSITISFLTQLNIIYIIIACLLSSVDVLTGYFGTAMPIRHRRFLDMATLLLGIRIYVYAVLFRILLFSHNIVINFSFLD